MREITIHNAAEYLRGTGRAAADEPIEVRELAGGVSNAVLLVTLPERGEQFVLKQARGRLRVEQEWLCPVERIWREVDVLRICRELLPARSDGAPAVARAGLTPIEGEIDIEVPHVLWEDRENFVYAMTAAPVEHRTWKEVLLAGQLAWSGTVANACGRL